MTFKPKGGSDVEIGKQKPRELFGGTLGLKEEPPLSLFTSCLVGARGS